MTANAIRVQLPGGAVYAPALHEAASKTGARSGLPKRTTNALTALVEASVALLNSGDSRVITLEMNVHDDSISAKLVGKGCTPPTKRRLGTLAKLADKKASGFETKESASAFTISFQV